MEIPRPQACTDQTADCGPVSGKPGRTVRSSVSFTEPKLAPGAVRVKPSAAPRTTEVCKLGYVNLSRFRPAPPRT
ncbi:hypothetical protein GCM10010411_66470 [Actinomadura fulvescens]|uniref:Uncharacterized protein n=2 Tax=Actinomadura fulvescens TaxID=46160 RepID=A0ABN3QAQ9_9ACTN